MNEKQVLKALEVIIDPDLHRNIEELGFVQNILISENDDVSFDLVLTTPACPLKEKFVVDCKKILSDLGAKSVSIALSGKTQPSQVNLSENTFLKDVSHILAVSSGKGGVGKSTVTANLAMALSLSGARVGILDADIYGPSMGLMLGIEEAPQVHPDKTISPVMAKGGISIVSMSMFADSEKATIWRGPMASQMIQNFLHRVRWGELDYLLVDFPPGTGDIQLTLTRNCPLSGAVVVTTPQEVALADCRKGVAMFDSVGVAVLGVVENMSYFVCDSCDKRHFIFRSGGGEKMTKLYGVPLLGQVPLEPFIADSGDLGAPAVLAHPNSVSAAEFVKIADQVVCGLSAIALSNESALTNYTYNWSEL